MTKLKNLNCVKNQIVTQLKNLNFLQNSIYVKKKKLEHFNTLTTAEILSGEYIRILAMFCPNKCFRLIIEKEGWHVRASLVVPASTVGVIPAQERSCYVPIRGLF